MIKIPAEWTDDCQGKKDFDCDIVRLDTRYWPRGGGFNTFDTATQKWGSTTDADRQHIKPSAKASICINLEDGDLLEDEFEGTLAERDFEGDTEEEVKQQVEKWANEEYNKVIKLLCAAYHKPLPKSITNAEATTKEENP